MNDIAGVHWQVAQATSIQNVWIYMSDSATKNHIGICTWPILPAV
jgi:hypothetical protein